MRAPVGLFTYNESERKKQRQTGADVSTAVKNKVANKLSRNPGLVPPVRRRAIRKTSCKYLTGIMPGIMSSISKFCSARPHLSLSKQSINLFEWKEGFQYGSI